MRFDVERGLLGLRERDGRARLGRRCAVAGVTPAQAGQLGVAAGNGERVGVEIAAVELGDRVGEAAGEHVAFAQERRSSSAPVSVLTSASTCRRDRGDAEARRQVLLLGRRSRAVRFDLAHDLGRQRADDDVRALLGDLGDARAEHVARRVRRRRSPCWSRVVPMSAMSGAPLRRSARTGRRRPSSVGVSPASHLPLLLRVDAHHRALVVAGRDGRVGRAAGREERVLVTTPVTLRAQVTVRGQRCRRSRAAGRRRRR